MLQQLAQSFAQVGANFSDQASNSGSAPPAVFWVIYGLIIILLVVSMWKVFKKAGRPGWAAIVPFYNTWVTLELGGQAGWWVLTVFIPFVGLWFLVLLIKSYVEISKRFGKSGAFALVLIFLPFIGYPILAFGKATYDPSRGSIPNNPGMGGGVPPMPGYPQPPATPVYNQMAQAGQFQQAEQPQPQAFMQMPPMSQAPQATQSFQQPQQPMQYTQPVSQPQQPQQPPNSNLVQ